VFRVGPFSIGGYQTFRHHDVVQPPPEAGSIVGMDVRVVDTDGVEIPQSKLMLHHNVFTNGGPDNTRDDRACPNNAVKERFYGQGVMDTRPAPERDGQKPHPIHGSRGIQAVRLQPPRPHVPGG
jgi:hypothetical protein